MFNIDHEPKLRDLFPINKQQLAQGYAVYRIFGVSVTYFSYINRDIAEAFGVDYEDVESKYKDVKLQPFDFWDSYFDINFVDHFSIEFVEQS